MSAIEPNTTFPVRIPSMKIVCERLGNCAFSHTKSNSVVMVSVNIDRLNSWPMHCESHLSKMMLGVSSCGGMHEKSTGGARNIMPIWKGDKQSRPWHSKSIVFYDEWWLRWYLVPGHGEFQHENDKTCKQLPFSNRSHQILYGIIGLGGFILGRHDRSSGG